MLKLILTLLVVANGLFSTAQKPPSGGLYSILVALMPNEGQKVSEWKKSDSSGLPIKWKNVLPDSSDYGDYKEGDIQIDFPKPYTCNRQTCNAEILLRGQIQVGSSFIELSCPIPDSVKDVCTIKELLGSENCQVKQINSFENDMVSSCSYEILIPKKAKIWAVAIIIAKKPTTLQMVFYSDEDAFKSKFN